MKIIDYGEWTIFSVGYSFYGRDWSVDQNFVYRGIIPRDQRLNIINELEKSLTPEQEVRVFCTHRGVLDISLYAN